MVFVLHHKDVENSPHYCDVKRALRGIKIFPCWCIFYATKLWWLPILFEKVYRRFYTNNKYSQITVAWVCAHACARFVIETFREIIIPGTRITRAHIKFLRYSTRRGANNNSIKPRSGAQKWEIRNMHSFARISVPFHSHHTIWY